MPSYCSLALLLTGSLLLAGTALAAPAPNAAGFTPSAEKTDLLVVPRTISETITLALSHPAIAARAAQVAAGHAGVGVAQSENLPSVSLDAQAGTQRYDADFGIHGTAPVGLARLNLSQSVFDAGARTSDVSAASARLNAAEGDLVWQRRQQVFAAAQAHIALWLAQQLLVGDQQSLEALQQIDTATRHRRAVGDATVTEVSEAASRVAAAKARVTAQQTALNAARQNYLSAVGESVTTVAAPTLPQIPTALAFEALPAEASQATDLQNFTPATQALLANAVLHHPLIAAAAARAAEAGAGIDHANAQEYPTLDLAANAQHDEFGGLQHNEANNTGIALVNLHYNIYQGGGIKAGERQAKALHKAAESDRDSISLQVSAETNASTARWLGAGQELAQQAVALQESRDVLGSLDAEMHQGNRTLRDLLDARRDEIDVLSAWLAAAAQQSLTAYDLQRWLGDETTTLTPGLLAAQPLRPDLSQTALNILPGVIWSDVAPKTQVVAAASATTPLPVLPLPVNVSESTMLLPLLTKLVTTTTVNPEKDIDLSAIVPSAGTISATSLAATPSASAIPANESPLVPALLQNLPAGAWLVYLPPSATKK